MNARKLKRLLTDYGCHILREGGGHEIWINPQTGAIASVPRHGEVARGTALSIVKELIGREAIRFVTSGWRDLFLWEQHTNFIFTRS